MRDHTPVFKLTKKNRKKLERFGSVKSYSEYHWQIRDEDGCLLADWWPHVRKFKIENEPTVVVGYDTPSHIAGLIAALLYEYPEFETEADCKAPSQEEGK